MNPYAEYLAPDSEWIPLLKNGTVFINENSNRVNWTKNGRFAGAFSPVVGKQAAQQLSSLPIDPIQAQAAIQQSAELNKIAPALQAMKLISSVGAIASVANLAVSCVGFALVLNKLEKMDAKLDQMMEKIDILSKSVDRIASHQKRITLSQIASGGECLDRAMAASTSDERRELARDARRRFQEGKMFYRELWRDTNPWYQYTVTLKAVREMQARLILCAIGEIQAEFTIGDEGAFRHAVESNSRMIRQELSIDPVKAFRSRSDGACLLGVEKLADFQKNIHNYVGVIKASAEATQWSANRIESFKDDFDMARELSLEPYEVARILRAADGATVYLLGPAGHARQWRHLAR